MIESGIVTLFTNATQIVCQFLLDDSSVPIVIKYIGCNVYQLLLVLTLCCAMMYVSRDIFVDRKEFMKKSWSYIILFCIAAFVISLTPEKLQLEGNYLYAYGLGVYVTYVFALVFIIAILIRVNVNSRKMNVDRRVAVNFWMGIWVMAALVELVIPQLFVVSFACSIGVMILYIRLENPGMNMDRQTGIYNHNAFMEFMAQLYGSQRAFSMFLVG